MSALKWISIAVAALVGVYVILARFSTSESVWACSGTITRGGAEENAEAYLRLEKYRPWVSLWSSSYGNLHLEIPNTTFQYYGHITSSGDNLTIYSSERGGIKGIFSMLSYSLMVDAGIGVFDGKCTERKMP